MGYKKSDPCLQKAFDDERLFVLMARDITSPRIVMEWIKENIDMQPEDKLREAFECALEMRNRRDDIIFRKQMEAEGWTSVHNKLPDGRFTCDVALRHGSIIQADFYYIVNKWSVPSRPGYVPEVEFWKNPVAIEIPYNINEEE